MKVFLSWSGNPSKALAEAFRNWLPGVLQAVRPYYTPDDIAKGTRWPTEIAKELEDCKVGIIFLTRDNLNAPWLMFEAGALSKKLDKSNVCPLLFGIEATDIQGPLVQFQAAKFDKLEVKRAVKMMNDLLPEALAMDVLDGVFDMWWPKLDKEITDILSKQGTAKPSALRSDRQLIEEILDLVRASSIKAIGVSTTSAQTVATLSTFAKKFQELADQMKETGVFEQQRALLLEMLDLLGSALVGFDVSSGQRKLMQNSLLTVMERLKGAAAFLEKTTEVPPEPEQDDVPF
jgi:hypothetical protein